MKKLLFLVMISWLFNQIETQGFLALNIDKEKTELKYARAKVYYTYHNLKTKYEYDFVENELKEANLSYLKSLGKFQTSLTAGRILNAVIGIYSPPCDYKPLRHSDVFKNHESYFDGIRLNLDKGNFSFKLGYDQKVITTLTYAGLTIFYEEDVGHGIVWKLLAEFGNLNIGYMSYLADSTLKSGFGRFSDNLTNKLSIYAQVDFVPNVFNDKFQIMGYMLVGLTYKYLPYSLAKLYFEGREDLLVLQLTHILKWPT